MPVVRVPLADTRVSRDGGAPALTHALEGVVFLGARTDATAIDV